MTRRVHTLVSLVLLTVLSGAPAVAVFCAEWCARPGDAAAAALAAPPVHGEHAHHALDAPSAPRPASDCHGPAGAGPRLGGDLAPECLDYAVSPATSGLLTQRLDMLPLAHVETVPAGLLASDVAWRRLAPGVTHVPPRRRAATSPVLRI